MKTKGRRYAAVIGFVVLLLIVTAVGVGCNNQDERFSVPIDVGKSIELISNRVKAPQKNIAITVHTNQILIHEENEWKTSPVGGSSCLELHVRQGELVKVNVTNGNVQAGLIPRWENAQLLSTQERAGGYLPPIQPGNSYTFALYPKQQGTYWFSLMTGVWGKLIVEPPQSPRG